MPDEALDRHQLAGLDDRKRGFSRPVEVERAGEGYRAVLRYESIRMATDPQPSAAAALQRLIATLQAQGYRQLKTQRSFRHGVYLGSQEPWVEYSDPPSSTLQSSGLWSRLAGWWRQASLRETGL